MLEEMYTTTMFPKNAAKKVSLNHLCSAGPFLYGLLRISSLQFDQIAHSFYIMLLL